MRWKTLPLVLFASLAAGCERNPTSPALEAAVAALLSTNRLEVGEALTVTGMQAQAVILAGGPTGSEYLLVPFNASETAVQTLSVEVTGGNVIAPTELSGSLSLSSPFGPGRRTPDAAFHERLRRLEQRELEPRIREASAGPIFSREPSLQVVPVEGELVTLNASLEACQNPRPRTGRVAAVTDRAIVVEDVGNPSGGFTDAEYRLIAETFDSLIYPVSAENFGEPSDIDENERVIIFYTRVVNELTERGAESFVGGFFFARDLFPVAECATSNEAEIFYLLAPDPTGEINNVWEKNVVLQRTLGTVAHEFQHLINAGRRIYVNDAAGFEEVWLNEGLSHIAEELVFYAASGLEPRQNLTLDDLRSNQSILRATITYQLSNLGRYESYLENPDEETLLGIDNLPTRGASWAFLRYAADQEDGPDQPLWFDLVNSDVAGLANLANAFTAEPLDLMQTWTASVFTDDFVPVESRLYLQPSWNFRSIMPALNEEGVFPLEILRLGGTEATLSLKGGGAAFLRFGVPADQRATLMVTSGGEIPPERLRVTVVRVR